jgi:deoxyribodipyrimidine photolyase-like uncharacterized protein
MVEQKTVYVRTRYAGATDSRGSTVAVEGIIGGKRVSRSFPYDYAARDAHLSAIRGFARLALGWDAYGRTVVRQTRSERGWVVRLDGPFED